MKYLKYLFMLIMLFTINVYADNYSVDFNKKGKLNITLTDKEENKTIEGVELTLYKIANVSEKEYHLFYEYVDKINCNASLDNLESSTLTNEINSCLNDDIIVMKKMTNKDGVVLFDNLELGLYLVKQTNKVKGYSSINSYLITIPKVVDNKFTYEISSKPKTDILKLIDINVKKIWNTPLSNKNDKENLPRYIEVGLYKNNELISKIKLNKDNNWSYTWEDLEKSDEYSILEVNVPKGYTATYEKIDNTVVITNTKTLVQTGNNYYLALIIGLLGIIFIMLGIFYNLKVKNEQDI